MELQGKVEKITSYTLFPTKSELSILQEWRCSGKQQWGESGPQGRNLSHRCVPGIPPTPAGRLTWQSPAERLLPSSLLEVRHVEKAGQDFWNATRVRVNLCFEQTSRPAAGRLPSRVA